MLRDFRNVTIALLTAGATAWSPVRAATPEEGAAEAAKAWGRAIVERDVDAQVKLLPATMFTKPGERERFRLQKVHEKEVAVINKRKFLSFDVQPPAQTLKMNKTVAVVLPYRSLLSVAEGKLQTDSALIALAEEGSNDWSVFDASGHGPRSLKVLIPGYTTALRLPPAVSKVIKGE
jgi:hypothetical protein